MTFGHPSQQQNECLLTGRRVVATLAADHERSRAALMLVSPVLRLNRCIGGSWNETQEQVQSLSTSPFLVRKCSSVWSKSRGAGVKLNHDFSDSSYRRPPVASFHRLKADFQEAGVTPAQKHLRHTHLHLSLWQFKLSECAQRGPQRWNTCTEALEHWEFFFSLLPLFAITLEANLVYVV